MNRISIRGVGIAAVAMVATSLAVSSNTPTADAQEAGVSVPRVSTFVLDLLSTNSNTALVFPGTLAGIRPWETAAAELTSIHGARSQAALARSAQAQSVAAKIAAQRAAAALKAARTKAASRANRSAVRPLPSGSVRALGQKMAAARGWTGGQWQCLDNVWMHESGWLLTAENSSGAYGIPQASPGSKMSSAGSDWRTNPVTQIAWGLSYIATDYGNPCQAWSFWQSHLWY